MTSSGLLPTVAGPRSMTVQNIVVASMPVVLVGLLVVTFAMLVAPWPADPPSPVTGGTISFGERIIGRQGEPPAAESELDAVWYLRRGVDGLMALVVLAGYAVVWACLRFQRQLWLLMLVSGGVVGMMYGAATGLYGGPIFVSGGFACVTFGAGLAWAAWPRTHQVFTGS